jgi:hypothetical protein
MTALLLASLLGCLTTSHYSARAEVRSVTSGGGSREFYVAADMFCGPALFPMVRSGQWHPVTIRIMRCEIVSSGKETKTQCDAVADTETLGVTSTAANGDRFKITSGNVMCPYLKLGGMDVSGFTPYDPETASDVNF